MTNSRAADNVEYEFRAHRSGELVVVRTVYEDAGPDAVGALIYSHTTRHSIDPSDPDAPNIMAKIIANYMKSEG